ncbi:phage tail sheath family protein [Yokenella regensburgei]|uniref:phage tail sheath family protein n=1 Tax=Yokenella regensburgei TaxID=158877 RepID=UPI003ED99BC1
MTVAISYPGVYIEELESTALSVSGNATAVPIIVVSESDTVFTDDATRINSWLDYVNHLGSPAAPEDNIRDACVRTYFENGGGYCYIVPTCCLEEHVPQLDDATLLVAAGQDIDTFVSLLCGEGKNLFAILDGPTEEPSDSPVVISTPNKYAAIYYPWLKASWAGMDIPPSAAVAGAYCLNDRSRGVWKAPANMALQGGVLPKYKVSNDFQGDHTTGGNALNMIRQFNNGSPLIWGARTSTAEEDAEWRYVPVRRLFNSAEKDIKDTMQTMMFEPNSQPTWERVRSAVNNYLYGLWRQGGLAGTTPEEAYFVQIGLGVTMTQADIDAGKMIVKVGMAAVRPAEFIILQFTQDVAQ